MTHRAPACLCVVVLLLSCAGCDDRAPAGAMSEESPVFPVLEGTPLIPMDDDMTSLRYVGNFAFEPQVGYFPVEPHEAVCTVDVNRNGVIESVDIRTLDNDELRDILGVMEQNVVISKVGFNGTLAYLAGSLTHEKGHYLAVTDFSKYIIKPHVTDDQQVVCSAKIGIGIRMAAEVHTKKRGVDLGSLFKIGLAASKNELSGALKLQVIGLSSSEITALVPGNFSTIDENSIQRALEGMAAIKAKIYEADTEVSAKVLSVNVNRTDLDCPFTLQSPSSSMLGYVPPSSP